MPITHHTDTNIDFTSVNFSHFNTNIVLADTNSECGGLHHTDNNIYQYQLIILIFQVYCEQALCLHLLQPHLLGAGGGDALTLSQVRIYST